MSRPWATKGYLVWLGAAAVSQLGNGMMAFAITWTATGVGGGVAGTVAAVGLVPTVVLLLFAGTTGDRFGQRRVLLVVTTLEVAQYLVFWGFLATPIPLVPVLLGNAVVAGVLQGLGAPSANVYARQFVSPEHVRPAIAVSSTLGSLVRIASPALGAACIAAVGLRGSLLVQAASFAGVLMVLTALTPPHQPTRNAATDRGKGVHGRPAVLEVLRHPAAGPLLAATLFIAAAILPFVGLGLPLMARARHWDAGVAGLLAASWTLGSVATSIAITARYARHPETRPRGLASGPGVAATCLSVLPWTRSLALCVVLCVVMGVGTALFTAHASPTLASLAPAEEQSRWSAASILAQFLPLLVINPLVGRLTETAGTTTTLLVLAVLAVFGCIFSAWASTRLHPNHPQPEGQR